MKTNNANEKTLGFTGDEYRAIGLLQTIRLGKNLSEKEAVFLLREQEVTFLQDFLVRNMGNIDLNKKLKAKGELLRASDMDWGRSYLETFTFCSGNNESFKELQFKLNDNVSALGTDIITDKITPKESEILNNAASKSMKNFLSDMKKCIKSFNVKKLEELENNVNNTHDKLQTIEKKILSELKIPSGSIISYNMEKNSQMHGGTYKYMNKIAKYGHSAILTINDGTVNQSHISPKYKLEPLSLRTYLTSDILEVNLEKLIKEEKKEELKVAILKKRPDTIGEKNPERVILELFEDVAKKVNQESAGIADKESPKRFDKAKAGNFNRGVKTFIIEKMFPSMMFKSKKMDPQKIHDKFLKEGDYENGKKEGYSDMLCSAFVARNLVTAIVELNQEIKEKYGVEDAIEFPFDENVRLGRILPERLHNILLKSKTFTLADPTKTASKIFDIPQTDIAQNIEIKTTKKRLEEIVENVIKSYKEAKEKHSLEETGLSKKDIKEMLTESVSMFFVTSLEEGKDEGKKPSIVIEENDFKFIKGHVEKLCKHIDHENSKGYARKFVETIMEYIGLKKKEQYKDHVKEEAKNIVKRIEGRNKPEAITGSTTPNKNINGDSGRGL